MYTSAAQDKILFTKLDNKNLPISKLDNKSLLELLDSAMLDSFDNSSVNYLVSQQLILKTYPLYMELIIYRVSLLMRSCIMSIQIKKILHI